MREVRQLTAVFARKGRGQSRASETVVDIEVERKDVRSRDTCECDRI
jgi:hypothetical protein